MKIKEITKEQFGEWVGLQLALWPEPRHSRKEIEEESVELLNNPKFKNLGAFNDNGKMIGFANISIRYDYVQGATKYPVGYLEGIFIKPEFRGQGIGKELEKAGEQWAKSQGCAEMASDAETGNTDSQNFHKSLGFQEDNRIVCFIKNISK